MWTVLDFNGDAVFWSPSWDVAVTWAMKHGGDFDIIFQPYLSLPEEGDG